MSRTVLYHEILAAFIFYGCMDSAKVLLRLRERGYFPSQARVNAALKVLLSRGKLCITPFSKNVFMLVDTF